MRLLISWVRDFVDVEAPPEEIAERLGVRGFEVAGVERLGGGDGVIDFEVTANRPDCLSVLGLAREIATLFDLPLAPPSAAPGARVALASVASGESDRVSATIDDPDLCPRYATAIADLSPSVTPAWMADRLGHAGLRAISPIVDITNYVLVELGQPMHAFDLTRLDGAELRVRTAHEGEGLVTLDGVERRLDAGMLVIADRTRPQAIAGVMGGAASEVSSETRTIAFESAHFKPASVRRTSKRLGLKTEASSRFERGADIGAPVIGLRRAIWLMHEMGAGRLVGPIVDRYPQPREALSLHLRRDRLAAVLGLRVPDVEVERILSSLGLQVAQAGGGWMVQVPTFRVDVQREVDLIEEVGRHYGFEHLQPAFPAMTRATPPPDAHISSDRRLRGILTAAGLDEAITFGFIESKAAKAFLPAGETAPLVAIANPLSAKFEVLRPSLLPGLLDAVAHNRRHGRRDVALFELGARFTAVEGETHGVGLAWTGAAATHHWSGTGREVDFFDLKGVVEQVCAALDVAVRVEPAPVPFLVTGQSARVIAGEHTIGVLGVLSPELSANRGAPSHDRIVMAELNVTQARALAVTREERVRPLARYPFVVRDLSVLVADTLSAEIIRGTIQAAGAACDAPLVSMAFFDRYKGKDLPEGTVSLSVRLTFQAADRTLTDAEVQASVERVRAALVAEHGAVQR